MTKGFLRRRSKSQSPREASQITFNKKTDARGVLIVGEVPLQVPFKVKRFFFVTGAPRGTQRGGHGHLRCHQLLIAVCGSVTVEVSDGDTKKSHILDGPDKGLHIPPLVWGVQRYHSEGSVLLVLCSHKYDSHDYFDTPEAIKVLRNRPWINTRFQSGFRTRISREAQQPDQP